MVAVGGEIGDGTCADCGQIGGGGGGGGAW